MAFLPSSLLLLIYASTQLPQACQAFPTLRREANDFQLSSQLTNFIPACAQSCFISFLNVNYDSSRLGTSPSLDTLCSHNSSSGYTIGEGAVECIVGEDEAGGCSKTGVGGDDGSPAIVQKAYDMCNGQNGALPNTHATLVATLSTSGSVVLIAPSVSVTSSTTISGTRISTTTSQSVTTSTPATITAPATTVASNVSITTASGSPTPLSSTSTSSVSSASASAPAAAASSSPAPAKDLQTSKVVGITVGSIGGAAAAVGLCVFLACLRKRRNRERDSDIFPFTPESTNSLAARRFTDYGRRQGQMEKGDGSPGFAPGGTRDGVAAKISPTFRPRNATPPPESGPTIRLVEDRDLGPSMRASRIGLAVSAEPSPALMPPQMSDNSRHPSRLLPEKPTLALQIPKQTYSRPGQMFNFPSPPRSQNSSIMNRGRPKIEFGPSRSSSNYSNGNQASQQYGAGNGNRQTGNTLSTDFQPYLEDTPYYPENVNTPYEQNMALRKYLASDQNLHVRPLEIRRSTQQSPTQASGGYSQSDNRGMASNYSNPNRPQNAYQSGYAPPQNYNRPPKKSYSAYQRPTQPPGRDSTGSATSFESFESGDDVEAMSPGGTITLASRKSNGPMDRRKSKISKELSPVKESPSPATLVSYPKIPGRLGTTVRMIPPPPQPDFTKVMGSGSVPRKPVPIPSQNGNGAGPKFGATAAGHKPWRQAELEAAARRRSVHASIHTQSPRDTIAPSAIYNTLPSQRQVGIPPYLPHLQPSYGGNGDRISTASTNSSLLAKRRGEKLAAGLTLRGGGSGDTMDSAYAQNMGGNQGNGNKGNANSKWRVLRDEDIKIAQSPGWRPQVGRQQQQQAAVNPYRMSRDLFLDDVGSGKENYEVGKGYGGRGQGQEVPPGTPGWKPRLTPTRRGDELFLSVQ